MERLRILGRSCRLGRVHGRATCRVSGASQETVRSVLKRDKQFFRRESGPDPRQPIRRPRRGRPAARYRVEQLTAIRAVILDLEREIDALPGARQALTSQAGGVPRRRMVDFEDRLADVMVAGVALVRAWYADESAICEVNADTAMRSVLQARPNNNFALDTSWDRRNSSEEEALERRILSISALARITTELRAIDAEQLGSIAFYISALQVVSPIERVWSLARAFGSIAVRGNELPPIALMTGNDTDPHEALQGLDGGTWIREVVQVAAEPLWVQEWARPLAASGLLLALIVVDPGSDERLVAALNERASKTLPTLVLSDRLDGSVVARVAEAGDVFVPRSAGFAGLSAAIMALADDQKYSTRAARDPYAFHR